MAELARREAGRGGCLLHMVKSHRNPLRFVPSLISQAAKLSGTQFGAEAYSGDVDDLRNAWVKALQAVRERTGRAVVVLDALDELETVGGRVTFLPPSLPEGVRVVLTCRPDIPLVNALRGRLRGCLEERELGPLSEEDFRLFLERRLGAERAAALATAVDLSKLFGRLEGNPLLLDGFVKGLAKRWGAEASVPPPIDWGRLPKTLEDVFRAIYDRVRGKEDGRPATEEGRQRVLLLQSLFLEDCHDRLEEMSQWLLDVGEGRFKPWHQGLTDFVRGQVLGEAGVRQIEEVFCRWLAQVSAETGRYGLRHRVAHLLVAGRRDDAATLLRDWHFLEAKTEAGLVFELARDFTQTVQALPPVHEQGRLLGLLEEALGRDIRFLQRHPSCLFQCLWNSGWWYDCAKAARHYALLPKWKRWGATLARWFRVPGVTAVVRALLPWERSGPKLSALLERWREEKEHAAPGFVWLRSLRPPAPHLGTAQKLVLRGHEDLVRSVCFSPDGTRLASGSRDKTVRGWFVASGECMQILPEMDAASAWSSPWRARRSTLESVIEDSSTGQPVAWLPTVVDKIVPHPSGRTWPGAVDNYVCLFTLEGDPAPSPRPTSLP
jgi:hypothetical protein